MAIGPIERAWQEQEQELMASTPTITDPESGLRLPVYLEPKAIAWIDDLLVWMERETFKAKG